jgi:hypothetical protein
MQRTVIIVLVGLLAAASPAAAVQLARGPYLQLLTTDAVTVVWRTDVDAECGLEIRAPEGVEGDPARVFSGNHGRACAVRATDLSPGTSYAYVPLGDGSALDIESVFRTDDPELPFAFAVLGDSGSGRAAQWAVRDRMLEHPLDFILHTGDMVYRDGEAKDYDPKFFEPYGDLLRSMVLWPTIGNHDRDDAVWSDAFHTPANNAAGSERYYSFDYGNAHVVVLDSTEKIDPGSRQQEFLAADLAASDALWTFVALHHSIYSSGTHGSSKGRREDLMPLFDAHGVDLVFMGHDHDYERTWRLRNDELATADEGTVYITTGGGGASIRSVGSSWFTAYAETAHHFVFVNVGGPVLTAAMVRDDGAVRDSVTLTKVPPQCGDGLVNQPTEACDGPDDAACPDACLSDCTCAPTCGDNQVNLPGEACDGTDDAMCPGLCRMDCRCGLPPVVLDLVPVADTYIDSNKTAAWEHGAADHVHIDGKPSAITYLKFDLRAAATPVETAELTLYCENRSVDGGTVYAVPSSSWIEGAGRGVDGDGANGPGLKWIDVDTNEDGTVDAQDASDYVPDLSQPIVVLGAVAAGEHVSVDVTVAFAAGPGFYTLALVSNSDDGASYSARESPVEARRPRLHVEMEPLVPCGSDAECADGVFCNGAEACEAGVCRPRAAVDCDDGVACTVDRCDETDAVCVHEPDHGRCNDAVECTDDTCVAAAGGCINLPDHHRCADGNVCTEDFCDPATGCDNPALPDGKPCADGDVCNGREACLSGECRGGKRLRCDDRDPCTSDHCDPLAGCWNLVMPDGASCADDDACNGHETCQGGICEPGTPLACDDGNPCTTDTCEASAGCRYGVSGLCGPLHLEPIADTYIERGDEATWDHGAAPHLDVDERPRGVTYLKFDLRTVSMPVELATLTLYCLNASKDGGTIYPVHDSSWIEGAGNGIDETSRGGIGLKWTDVDVDQDGAIGPGDDSPYVPDYTRPVATLGAVVKKQTLTLDVTAVFDNGPGIYTLAIGGSMSSDGVTYASRQHPTVERRPRLGLIQSGPMPPGAP